MKIYLEVYQILGIDSFCESIDVTDLTEDEVSQVIVKMQSKYGAVCKVGCFIRRR